MGFKNRYLSMFMVICIVLSMFSGLASAAPGDDPVQEVPGALILSKLPTAHVTGSDEWEITLSLNGLDKITTTDIVLVLDSSGSMADRNRMNNTKAAARDFVSQLIKPGDANTRIAVVTFNDSARVESGFSNNSTALNSAINGAYAFEGTHMQSGILKAHDLLNNSSARNKYIVLLGDGDPTYSYQVTNVTGGSVSVASCSGSGQNHVAVFNYDMATLNLTFATDSRVGLGSSYNLSSGNVNYTYNGHNHTFPNNNGIPAIYEAKLAKEHGIEFYSIGLGLDSASQGRQVLLECSSGAGYFYPMDDYNPTALTNAFKEIADNIAYAATQVVINDPMGPMFTLDESSIVVKKGGALESSPDFDIVMDGGVQKIIWNLSSVENSSSPITMSYKIKINQTVDPRENFATNGNTTIDYIDVDGNPVSKEFFVPVVNSGDFGIVTVNCYLVDDDGYALNPQGGRAQNIGDIAILHQYVYEENGYQSHNGNVNVAAPSSLKLISPINNTEVTSVPVPGTARNFGNNSPAHIFIDVANQQHYVYFAYKVQDTFNVSFHANAGSDSVSNMPANLTDVIGKISEPSPAPTRSGYQFKGWSTDASGSLMWIFNTDSVIQDTNLYAIWEMGQYNITYNSIVSGALVVNGQTNPGTYNITSTVTLHALEKLGYTFNGWYENAGFTGSPVTSFGPGASGDKAFHAKWGDGSGNPDQYAITYVNSVGGTAVGGTNVDTYTVDSTVTLYPLAKTGYTFNGWYDNAGFTGSPVTTFGPGETGAKTFYASWGNDPTNPTPDEYAIAYHDVLSGTIVNGLTNPSTYNVSSTVVLNDLEKLGYTFNGWYAISDFSGSPVATFGPGETGAKNFYASWGNDPTNPTPDEYNITYVDTLNGTVVNGLTNPSTYNVTSQVTLNDLEVSGYAFNGWFTDAARSTAAVNPFGPGETGDKTFYAKWSSTTRGGGTGGGTIIEPVEPTDISSDDEPSGDEPSKPPVEVVTPKQVHMFMLFLLFALAIICGLIRTWINVKAKDE